MDREIVVTRNHTLDAVSLWERAQSMLQSLAVEYQLSVFWDDQLKCIRFECSTEGALARGITGQLHVNQTEIKVLMHLPFLLATQRASIIESINEQLDATMGVANV